MGFNQSQNDIHVKTHKTYVINKIAVVHLNCNQKVEIMLYLLIALGIFFIAVGVAFFNESKSAH